MKARNFVLLSAVLSICMVFTGPAFTQNKVTGTQLIGPQGAKLCSGTIKGKKVVMCRGEPCGAPGSTCNGHGDCCALHSGRPECINPGPDEPDCISTVR
jgi:hypothetical protein